MKISTNPLSAKLRRRIIMAKRGIENINKKTCILGCAVFFVFCFFLRNVHLLRIMRQKTRAKTNMPK